MTYFILDKGVAIRNTMNQKPVINAMPDSQETRGQKITKRMKNYIR